jgi:DNA-binding CsgD family transcriptional regulator
MGAERDVKLLMRVVSELRDPWAIAFAQAAAFVTYFLFAAPLWQSLVAAIAVLGARVGAGLTSPLSTPTIPPRSLLDEAEVAVALYAGIGRTIEEIARRTQSSEEIVRARKASIMTKLGFEHDWELREWAIAVGIIPEPPARHWYERSIVRGTLAGGGLIGLFWTSYQIIQWILRTLFS